jgi:transposase
MASKVVKDVVLLKKNSFHQKDIRDLRDLTRYHKKLIHDPTFERNRIHKILQDANIKLTSVFSDIFGVSGRAVFLRP